MSTTKSKRKNKSKTRAEELMDELIAECNSPEEIIGKDGLIKQLTKALVERATKKMTLKATIPGIHETERARKPSKAISAKWKSMFHVTETPLMSQK